jgi:hypothetical protein
VGFVVDLLFTPQMIYEYGEPRWINTDRRKPKNWEKTCPSATLPTANPTWTDPVANPGTRCEKPATHLLNQGLAVTCLLVYVYALRRPEICLIYLQEKILDVSPLLANYVFAAIFPFRDTC